MKEMTERLAHRFIKDFNLPIPLESKDLLPYYIDLYDSVFNTRYKLEIFKEMIKDFESEEDFYNYRNGVVHEVLEFIENQDSYKEFNQRELGLDYSITTGRDKTIRNSSIYSLSNVGKYFLSIDLKSANFVVLKSIDKNLVKGKDTWEEFMSEFTEYEYLKKSKHLRQSLLGKLNSKRIMKYAKYLLESKVIKPLLDRKQIKLEQIVSHNYDEFIIELEEQSNIDKILKDNEIIDSSDLNIRKFKLLQISNKYLYFVKVEDSGRIEFKGVDKRVFPQVFKYYFNLPIENKDLLFTTELGIPAKFLEPIKI